MSKSSEAYLSARDRFYMSIGVKLGDIAVAVAHNAASNSETTTSVFANQRHSITKLLKAGVGLELDLHWNDRTEEIDVCHSPLVGCLDPLLDRTPLKDVVAEISNFTKKNPDRFVFIDFEDGKIAGAIGPITAEEIAQIFADLSGVRFKSADDFKEFLTNFFTKNPSQECVNNFYFPEIEKIIRPPIEVNKDAASPPDPVALREEVRKQVEDYYSGSQEFISVFESHLKEKFESAAAVNGMGKSVLNQIYADISRKCQQDGSECINHELAVSDRLYGSANFLQNLPEILSERCYTEGGDIRNLEISPERRVIMASQDGGLGRVKYALADEFFKQAIAQIYAIKSGEREDDVVVPSSFFSNPYPKRGIEMGSRLDLDQDLCDYFRRESASKEKHHGLTSSFDGALGAPFSNTYNKEVIERLLDCGVNVFKFDYVEECDARLLQIDEFNLLKILDRDDISQEAKETCRDLLATNHELSKTAQYPFPINSAFLAPLIGKPLAQLETLFAAAQYYSGVNVDRYEEMISSAQDKYKTHNSLWTFVSSAAMGALRETVPALESHGMNKYVSWGLKAAISATDLYLYSQSIVPLGASMLAASAAEKCGFDPITVTALKYGCSVLVNYALDPSASLTDVALNSGLSMGGAVLGASAVKLMSDKYKKSHKVKDDGDLEVGTWLSRISNSEGSNPNKTRSA